MESANTRKLTIVGFTGRAGSGKDHMAEMLWRTHGFMPIGFADSMKEILAATEGLSIFDMHGPDKPDSLRQRMQQFGTEENRDRDEDIWVRHAEARMWTLAHKINHHRFAFTDVRFTNEAEFIHKYGGFVIWLKGRGHDLSNEATQHRSENQPIDADLAVTNSKDRSALAEEEVRRFVMSWVVAKCQQE